MSGSRLVTAVLGFQLFLVLAASPAFAADKSLTGKISDSMCGAKHQMPGDEAGCTRACVKQGGKYALVVGDKVYTLNTEDKKTLDTLNDLAGSQAKVTGEVNGDTVQVKSVTKGS